MFLFFFFKQKTAYEMRISDWSSDVCSSDLSGSDRLGEHRLTPDSPTRRFVTRCCNSPIALEFTKGHWLSVYSGRIPEGERPPGEMRTMVMGRPEGVELPGDIPNYKTPSGKFMWRLLKAWAAMGFRAPPVEATKGYGR